MVISTNEILYRIKKALNLTNEEMIEAYRLEAYPMEMSRLDSLLRRRQDKNFQLCSYEELGVFLDGLVLLKRGPSPKKANEEKTEEEEAVELTNNLILKKLRIALELKEPEVEIIFGLGDTLLTKQQLAALFRKEDHKNFKTCSDELLMAFMDGLDEFYYIGEID